MGYTAVVSREIGDTTQGFEWAAVDENRNIVEEIWDGGLGSAYLATKIQIKEQGYASTSLDKILLEVYVTDSRVIIKCDKYDKGDSRWIGGLSALAMNAIEKGIGAVRSRGKALIGHIRYEWLAKIYYFQKTGFLTDNTLRLVYLDNEGEEKVVELLFKKDADMAAIANKIFHKAVAYRRAMTDDKKEKLINFLNEYSDPGKCIPVSTGNKEMSGIGFPTIYYAPFGAEYRPEGLIDSEHRAPLPVNEPEVGQLPEADTVNENAAAMQQPEESLQRQCVIINVLSGQEIPVNGDTFTIGRSPARCDYVINSPTVSSTHARIISEGGNAYIEDLNSSNHTYVNGEMITGSGRVLLNDGDVIKLAKEEFRVAIR